MGRGAIANSSCPSFRLSPSLKCRSMIRPPTCGVTVTVSKCRVEPDFIQISRDILRLRKSGRYQRGWRRSGSGFGAAAGAADRRDQSQRGNQSYRDRPTLWLLHPSHHDTSCPSRSTRNAPLVLSVCWAALSLPTFVTKSCGIPIKCPVSRQRRPQWRSLQIGASRRGALRRLRRERGLEANRANQSLVLRSEWILALTTV